jgi:hypothetical protein
MMQKKDFSFKYVLLEGFFVVLGVFLAFNINNYREDLKEQNRSEIALESIYDEIKSNKILLEQSITYNQYLMDTLKVYFKKENIFPKPSLFHSGFVSRTIFYTNAWDVAVSTNSLHHLDYEQYLKLSELYLKFTNYNKIKDREGLFIYEDIYRKGTFEIGRNYKNLYSIIIGNYYLERELVKKFSEIEKLKATFE